MEFNRCYGGDIERLKEDIRSNFDAPYSAFCSLYPIFYANIVAPQYRIMNEKAIRKKLLVSDNAILSKYLDK